MFFRSRTAARSSSACSAGHDAGLDIVAEGEDRDGRAPDGEARRGHDGRDKALEPLPAFRQLGGDPRAAGMNFDADMVGDEPHDAFGVGGRDAEARVLEAARQPVDPEPAVGIEHHLDDGRIFEKARDRWSERRAQHACAARESFRSERDRRHVAPRFGASDRGGCQRGRLERAITGAKQRR